MKISDIIVTKTLSEGILKAVFTVTIDDCITVSDIKVIQGKTKLFVVMPNRKDKNGVYTDIVYPATSEAKEQFESTILKAYEKYSEIVKALET